MSTQAEIDREVERRVTLRLQEEERIDRESEVVRRGVVNAGKSFLFWVFVVIPVALIGIPFALAMLYRLGQYLGVIE